MLCLGLSSCKHKGEGSVVVGQQGGVTVHTITAEEKTRPVLEEVVGTVREKSAASIEAKVSGRISKMYVDLGQRVAKDQLLAEIDAKLLNHDEVLKLIIQELQPLLSPPPEPPAKEMGFHAKEEPPAYGVISIKMTKKKIMMKRKRKKNS